MLRIKSHFVMILLTVLGFTAHTLAATTGSVTITGTETETSGIWDIGTVTVTVNGYPETVPYGQFSTPDSLASAVAAKFTSDCNGPANARSAPGGIVNFRMRGGTTLASLTITESSSVSFAGTANPGASITPTTTLATIGSTLLSSGTSTTVAVQVSCGSACGSVYYQLDGGNWGTVSLNSSGQYSATTSTALAAGLHNVVVYYQGNDTYLPSSSNPVSFTITSGSTTPTSLYSYTITPSGGSSGYTLNSNIASYDDSVLGSWSNVAYDGLNRLSKTQVSPALTSGMPYYCWTYDSFGNRLTQNNSTASFGSGCSSSGTVATDTQSYGTNNRITASTLPYGSFTPDNSGNITADPAHGYAYDAEGRLCAMSTTLGSITSYEGYLYDAEGNRVAKGSQSSMSCDMTSNEFSATAQFILGPDGKTTTVVDGSGGWVHTDVNAGGKLLASYDGSGLHFHLTDWLGTRRMQTDYAGNSEDSYKNLPYGEPIGSLAGATEKNFTGQEYDSESGNDYFEARYYGSSMGRFASPDPTGLTFADITNPQSLNLYSYVLNNPLIYIDPSGTTCQTNSSDGTVYDDLDGNGCATVDDADKRFHGYDVNANGSNLLDQMNLQTNIRYVTSWLQSQAPPPQLAVSARQFINTVASKTAGFPTVCSAGGSLQLGNSAGGTGVSYDSNSGVKGNGAIRPTPENVGDAMNPVSLQVKGNPFKGEYSFGVSIRDPDVAAPWGQLGAGVSISDKGSPTVNVSDRFWGIVTVTASASLGSIGDPKCQHP